MGDGRRSYDAGVAFGTTGAFAELRRGAVDIDAFSASSSTVGGGVGYQIPLNGRGTVQLCPTADVEVGHGPNDINGTGLNYKETDASFGLAAGVIATDPAQRIQVVPTVAIAIATATSTLSEPLFPGWGAGPQSTSFGILRLGIGVGIRDEVSVTPYLSRGLGGSGATTAFGLTVRFTLGRSRTSALTTRATSCAGLAGADSVVYDTTQVTERPSLRSAPDPWYPTLQRDLGIEGRVILDVVVGSDGTPDAGSARIVQDVVPALDHEALRWIWNVSYWPACRDGRPVRARVAQPVDFCISSKCRRGKS
ncbi:MAG TPA: energy transducer TonB [Gemmatimonadales bacterium]|nr:energy transducer TonB [Gemmatimonadales bacterium]